MHHIHYIYKYFNFVIFTKVSLALSIRICPVILVRQFVCFCLSNCHN